MRKSGNFPVLHATLQDDLSGPLPKSALAALKPPKRGSNSSSSSDCNTPVIGGDFKDGDYSWLARGSRLVIISPKANSVISIYDFKQTFKELHFTVTACCACENLIIVGLKSLDGRGCVAVYKPHITKLLKAIDIPYPVTALEAITSCGGAVSSTRCLYENLRWLFGIVAVGTEEGHLYLLDLRFDGPDYVESIPSRSEIVPSALRNVPKTRENVVADNAYLAFEVQASSHEEGVFHYALPDDEILESYYPSDASITTLLYESRVASLFVGFSFGQFQIISLHDMNLVFSSDFEASNAPVSQFSFQEPENDPRKYCYLWVAKGQTSILAPPAPLTISMFQLCYGKKDILATRSQELDKSSKTKSARVLYKDFETCCMRFQHSLGPGLVSNPSECYGSVLHMCRTAEKYASDTDPLEPPDEEDIDYCLSPSTSFCIFGWQTVKDKHGRNPELNVIVFDINRWYMAQMPQNFQGDEDDSLFAAFWSFDGNQAFLAEDENILGMHVPKERIHHFSSGKRPLPERYFLPSSCSFSLYFITNQSVNHYSLYGYQQQVLNTAAEHKSICLVNPKQLHSDILASKLYLKHSRSQAFTPDMMRENILTAALEHGQVAFLLTVVRDLSSGQLAACGCTLRFIMDWAWKSVAHVKSSIDELCVPIFDCTSPALDALIKSQLQFSATQIQHLQIIFHKLMEYTEDASAQSRQELNTKLNVVTLIYQYLKAVQWFINTGLLPEQFDDAGNNDEIVTPNGILIYKYSRIREAFDQRRSELDRLNTPDLLIIDGWIEEIGEPLTCRWTKEEGGKPTYPPPSFMSLLDMYYIDCVDVITKHCLVMYLLYDIMAMFSALDKEDEGPHSELRRERLSRMASFLDVFSVPAGLIKLTQGFWLLDHQNFQEALAIFLDADTSRPDSSWQDRRILRAFLYQGHPAMALKYISARHPKVETIDDAKMHITVYIKSRESLKAWNLVQVSVGQHDTNELFSHLFTLCQQHSQLDHLLKLPLTETEEDMVVNYLKESKSPESTQILVLFYLQKSKYIEAIKLHSQSKHIRLMRDQSEESRRRNAKLDHIVQAYSNLLPKIEREVSFSSQRFIKQRAVVHREVHKPSTHPAILHPALSTEPSSHAGRLVSYMNKMEQKKLNAQEPLMTPLRRRPFKSKVSDANVFVYPTIDVSKRRSSIDIQGSRGRRSSFGSPARPSFTNDSRGTGSHSTTLKSSSAVPRDRRLSSLSVASMLLQTPPIAKRRPSSIQQDVIPIIQTPQSILKVKKLGLLTKDRDRTPSLSAISQASSRQNEEPMKIDHNETIESESAVSESSGHMKQEIPTISTPSAKLFNQSSLKRFKLEAEAALDNEPSKFGFDAPKRLRFAGLESSVDDSGPSAVASPAEPQMEDVEKEENPEEMLVDVTGTSDNQETGGEHNIAPPLQEINEDQEKGEEISAILPTEEKETSAVFLEEQAQISAIPHDEEKLSQPVELWDVEEEEKEQVSEEEEELETSDEKLEEGALPFQEPDFAMPLFAQDEDDDEVICLDSSSEDNEEEYDGSNEIEDRPQEQEADKEILDNLQEEAQETVKQTNESLRLVLTSSEEGSMGEGDVHDAYGSEEFMVEQEDSEDVPQLNTSLDPVAETEDLAQEEQQIELISDHEEKEATASEQNLTEEKSIPDEPIDTFTEEEMVEKDVFLGQVTHDDHEENQEFGVDEKSEDVDSQQMEGEGDVSRELFVPHLVQHQEDTEILTTYEEIKTYDAELEVVGAEEQKQEEVYKEKEEDIAASSNVLQKDDEAESSTAAENVDNIRESLSVQIESSGGQEEEEDVCKEEEEDIEPSSDAFQKDDEAESSTAAEKVIDVRESLSAEIESSEDQGLRLHLSAAEDDSSSAMEEENEEKEQVNVSQEVKENPLHEERKENMQKKEQSPETVEKVKADQNDALILDDEPEIAQQNADQEPNKDSDIEDTKESEGKQDNVEVEKMKEAETVENEDTKASIEIVVDPATPIVQRVRAEPEFVLSPPTTRRSKKKTSRGTQYTPKPAQTEGSKITKSPARSTRSTSKQTQITPAPEPTFLFSPPKTRTRSSRKKDRSENKTASQQSNTLSPPKSTTKRTRSKTKSSDRDSDRSSTSLSPVRRSTRKKGSKTTEKADESPDRKQVPSTPPGSKPPSTPTRKTRQSPSRTRQSPGRKLPPTPTRSSSRIKAQVQVSSANDSETPSEPPEEEPIALTTRTRRRKTSVSSDVASSEAESEAPSTPSRRSGRKPTSKSKPSPSQDIVKIPELTPLPEEDEEQISNKKRRKEKSSSTKTDRVTRSTSTTYATRMRRKAKIFTLKE